MSDATHASFFSGVGGLDLGLERAGWRTVSFSEIDPYASAVLAERWPGVPNLGDIVRVAAGEQGHSPDGRRGAADGQSDTGDPWAAAALWTGGFPCQDLSVAGKRRGMVEGSRSNLAHAFLDLVERHRPPAILLENVPGLLSSHRGRDMAALTGRLAELGYGVAYRVLDARHFGVPQRRRRVFILGLRSDPDDPTGRAAAERAATVLAVGSRCPRHPATGGEAGPDAAGGAHVGTLDTGLGHHGGAWGDKAVSAGHVVAQSLRSNPYADHHGDDRKLVVSPTPDSGGVRAADGLAGRLDDIDNLAPTLLAPGAEGGRRDKIPVTIQSLDTKRGGPDDNEAQAGHLIVGFSENQRGEVLTHETAHQLTSGGKPGQGYSAVLGASGVIADDPLLPLGLDSHRYRCCGNGVVAPVSEWIGRALLQKIESHAA